MNNIVPTNRSFAPVLDNTIIGIAQIILDNDITPAQIQSAINLIFSASDDANDDDDTDA